MVYLGSTIDQHFRCVSVAYSSTPCQRRPDSKCPTRASLSDSLRIRRRVTDCLTDTDSSICRGGRPRRPGQATCCIRPTHDQVPSVVQQQIIRLVNLISSATGSLLPQASSSVPLESETRSGGGGSVLGAMALITGTSVGAGMLALPSETAPSGFFPSATFLCASWLFLTFQAFLIAQVNVALIDKRDRREAALVESDQPDSTSHVISLGTMAEETLGGIGGTACTVMYIFLSYTLMVAYIAKGAEVLAGVGCMSEDLAACLFTFGLGAVVFAGDTESTDWLNRVMTGALLALFGAIIFGGLSSANVSDLVAQDWSQAHKMLPVVFLSLVYHDLIPVICAYLDGDLGRIRRAIVFGSALPLGMFLLWDAVALSLSHGISGADPLELLARSGGPGQAAVLQGFSLLAVLTSFLGTALGMSEFFMEQLGPLSTALASFAGRPLANCGEAVQARSKATCWREPSTVGPTTIVQESAAESLCLDGQERQRLLHHGAASEDAGGAGRGLDMTGGGPKRAVLSRAHGLPGDEDRLGDRAAEGSACHSWLLRAAAFGLVLFPPVILSSSIPDAFFAASEAAGAYGMTVLYGILPQLMFWRMQQQQKEEQEAKVSTARAPRQVEGSSFSEGIWGRPAGGMALAGMTACSVAVMLSQAALDLSKGQAATPSSPVPAPVVTLASSSQPMSGKTASASAALLLHTQPAPAPPSLSFDDDDVDQQTA